MKNYSSLFLAKVLVFSLVFGSVLLHAPWAKAEVDPFPSALSTETTTTLPDIAPDLAAPAAETASSTSEPSNAVDETIQLKEEPLIRVGIYKTDKKVVFVSPYPYTLWSGEADEGVLPENEVATLTYVDGQYVFESSSLTVTSTFYFRLVPDDFSNYYSIVNLDRHLVTRSQMNFNAFRGALEYRFSPKSGMPYVIDELLLENYVAGIAETSNGAPDEYIKALQIAARSYAYTLLAPNTAAHMFDVYASTVDQLYLGYNFESFSPRIAFFTAGTRGLMVTYNDEPVTTYYFSRSNGYTKTKKNVPWLRAVSTKYDKGKKMLGHGYGMSNHDAVMRASRDAWNYDKILGYYYSSTKIQQVY